MTTVLGVDVGFGDCKYVYGNIDGSIDRVSKFNSVLGAVEKSEHVQDPRLHEYHGNHYFIGELALNLESDKIIDVLTYENLETYSPLIVKAIIDKLPEVPSVIVVGLSIAHIAYSGYFREAIRKYLVDDCKMEIKGVFVLPQGIGGKVAFDRYGLTFPSISDSFSDNSNYIGVDVGFNTLDIFQVIGNKTSSNLVRGLENQGIVVIVNNLREYIESKIGTRYSIKETKNFLDTGRLKIRNNSIPLEAPIKGFKLDYINRLKVLIENEFGSILDKTDEMRLFGGGSYILSTMKDDFVKIPNERAEFYNAIGQYLHAITKFKEIKD